MFFTKHQESNRWFYLATLNPRTKLGKIEMLFSSFREPGAKLEGQFECSISIAGRRFTVSMEYSYKVLASTSQRYRGGVNAAQQMPYFNKKTGRRVLFQTPC
jgi:hypothetical protein